MSEITLPDGNPYYDNSDLLKAHPDKYLEMGCKSKPRRITARRNIPSTSYKYAYFVKSNSSWVVSDDATKCAHLFLAKSWVDANFHSSLDSLPMHTVTVVTPTTVDAPVTVVAAPKPKMYKMAPPLLELEYSEKFRDADGNVCEIETRGNRHQNEIHFRVKDVATYFKLENLVKIILNGKTEYERENHYNTFVRAPLNLVELSKNASRNALYLTYSGLVRVLMVSKNKHVKQFQDWAEKSLFTLQMGTQQQKEEMGAEIANIPLKNYLAMFNTCSSSVPCIYMVFLGLVKDLRATFAIPESYDDSLKVYKFGFTENYTRRLTEINNQYGKLANVTVVPVMFNMIDPKFTSEAEGDVRSFCDLFSKSLDTGDKYRELIILNDNELKQMKTQYTMIGNQYAGATAEMQKQIQTLKDQIQKMESEMKFMKDKMESERKIMDISSRHALLEKDNLILERVREKELVQHKLDMITAEYQHEIKRSLVEKENYQLKLQLASH
jgi:hypothetical protein